MIAGLVRIGQDGQIPGAGAAMAAENMASIAAMRTKRIFDENDLARK